MGPRAALLFAMGVLVSGYAFAQVTPEATAAVPVQDQTTAETTTAQPVPMEETAFRATEAGMPTVTTTETEMMPATEAPMATEDEPMAPTGMDTAATEGEMMPTAESGEMSGPVATALQQATETIADVIANSEPLSTVASLLEQAGLNEALSGEGPFTIFAPVNEAFANVPPELIEALQNQPEALATVLQYHVIPGLLDSRRLLELVMQNITTLEGEDIQLDTDDEVGAIALMTPGSISFVVNPDMVATNGIVHQISGPLLPLAVRDIVEGALATAQQAVQENMGALEEMCEPEPNQYAVDNPGTFDFEPVCIRVNPEDLDNPAGCGPPEEDYVECICVPEEEVDDLVEDCMEFYADMAEGMPPPDAPTGPEMPPPGAPTGPEMPPPGAPMGQEMSPPDAPVAQEQ